MNKTLVAVRYALVLALVGVSGFFLYQNVVPYVTPPCSTPLLYTVGTIDPRFGISATELSAALGEAATVWNRAAGKEVLRAAGQDAADAVPVDLVYSDAQKVSELGEALDETQREFDRKKEAVETLREEFLASKSAYGIRAALFDNAAAAYHEQVRYWNAQGGAPEQEFEALEAEQQRLQKEQEALKRLAESLNALSERLNAAVDALNTAARAINAKVGVYNERAGEDFDQGHYQHDGEDARIRIFQFDTKEDLTRILAHELGHALGIDHVENPESIMYSYNIGDGLALSEEDHAALKVACRLDK